MTRRSDQFTAGCASLIACLTVAIGLAMPAAPADAQTNPARQTQASPARAFPDGSTPGDGAGMLIYIDPQTGALRPDPAPGTAPLQLTPAVQNALSTSHQGLVEAPSITPGGGVVVDLQGRFQSPMFVTIDGKKQITIQHMEPRHDPGERK